MSDRDRLLQRIATLDFAVVELHLFLDTHPNDTATAEKLAAFEMKSKELTSEFEEKFGPLTTSQLDANRWAWIANPWPWDVSEECDC